MNAPCASGACHKLICLPTSTSSACSTNAYRQSACNQGHPPSSRLKPHCTDSGAASSTQRSGATQRIAPAWNCHQRWWSSWGTLRRPSTICPASCSRSSRRRRASWRTRCRRSSARARTSRSQRAAVLLAALRLRLRGETLEEGHALRKEQDRLQRYERKLKRAAAEDELARTRPGTELNVAAANRFISQAIPDLTPEQRQQLREQNAAGKRGAGCGGEGGGKRQRGSGAGGRGSGGGRGGGGRGAGSMQDIAEIMAAAMDDGA
ncbi:MAG: hypothetical protein J3K34DRAFT_482503 [Monoraphidium minutum]|nr:MAG: hypothetical protein J3K34DRAFT_482503 [Monoraphidium minutum]